VTGPRHPVPRGLAGYPQPKLAGRATFGKPPFLTAPLVRCPRHERSCPRL